MTLYELLEKGKSWFRAVSNFRDHPEQVLQSQGQRIWEQKSKTLNEKLDLKKLSDRVLHPQQSSETTQSLSQATHPSSQLNRAVLSEPSTLAEGTQIQEYTIRRCLDAEVQPFEDLPHRAYLYEAINLNNELVWLKEYQFPERDFKPEKAKQKQAAFEQIVGWNLKIGHGPDFRLLKVLNVFSQERSSYLVTQPLTQAMSLRQYLATQGAMSASEVREVLRQVLETLCFLHSAYRVRLGDKFERNLPHGNLSLDSLRIKLSGTHAIAKARRFFIYATDLMLWEQLIKKPTIAKSVTDLGSVAEDLQALGILGFQLLGGQLEDGATLSTLKDGRTWQEIDDQGLKSFIQRLVGLGNPLPSAEVALQILITTLSESEIADVKEIDTEEAPEDSSFPILGYSVLFLALVGFILFTWLFLNPFFNHKNLNSKSNSSSSSDSLIPSSTQPAFSKGVKYAIELGSAWEEILNHRLIHSDARKTSIAQELNSVSSRSEPRQEILDSVRSGKIDVAFVVMDDQTIQGVEQIAIAMDALIIFVAFSDGNYQGNIPTKLNQKITINEVKQIFTSGGKIRENLNTKPYFPDDSSVLELFKKIVLHRSDSKKFDTLFIRRKTEDQQELKALSKASKPTRNNIYEKILTSFENDSEVVAIGFDRLSRVYGQCSVYPLKVEGKQVLVKTDGQPIDLNTDLCGDKGSYQPQFLEKYPFTYKLGIIYQKSNEAKAKQLAETLQNKFRETLAQLGVTLISTGNKQ